MLNIFNKVKSLKKIEKVYRMSLFFPSTVSFAMNNRNNEVQAANGNININNSANNSERDTVYNDIIDKINNQHKDCPDDKKIKFKKFLGEGGFGEVVLVEKGQAELALKITKYTEADVNEGNALCRLKGKTGIVNFYGCGIFPKENNPKENNPKENNPKEKFLFFYLEYCKYGNIRNFMGKILKNNVMSETLVCYIAGQVVNALKNMHSIGLAYFDLKPANILVDDFINFKLSDFSTTYKYNKGMKKYAQLGTEPYIAPEVLKKSEIEKYENFFKPDVFSLGVMCYRLFTNAFPYFNNNNVYIDFFGEINHLICIEKNDINLKELEDYGASDVFKDFLLKCLEKDVNKRQNIFQLEKHPFIKQYEILLNEKEKLYNIGIFFKCMAHDYFKSYDDECNKYKLEEGILTLKNNNVKVKDNKYGNKGDLGQFMDNKFVSKKNIIEDTLKKNNKEKTLKKIEKGKKK